MGSEYFAGQRCTLGGQLGHRPPPQNLVGEVLARGIMELDGRPQLESPLDSRSLYAVNPSGTRALAANYSGLNLNSEIEYHCFALTWLSFS
jgi:hypothetical protein